MLSESDTMLENLETWVHLKEAEQIRNQIEFKYIKYGNSHFRLHLIHSHCIFYFRKY